MYYSILVNIYSCVPLSLSGRWERAIRCENADHNQLKLSDSLDICFELNHETKVLGQQIEGRSRKSRCRLGRPLNRSSPSTFPMNQSSSSIRLIIKAIEYNM